jgi:hypothetical protein
MGKKASTLEYRTLKSDKAVRPYDPRDKKQKEITDKQNPISLYDEQTKELVYTEARGGGLAISGKKFIGVK